MIKNKKGLIDNSYDNNIRKARKEIVDSIEYCLKEIDAKKSVLYNIDKIQSIIKTEHIDNIYIISVGKASIPMAQSIVDIFDVTDGIVVTDKECGNCNINCMRSSHPIPSRQSVEAAQYMLQIVNKATKDDLLIFLISGGGSALVEIPRVKLEDLQKTTDALIRHSLSINEVNCIRKHLSSIKGGQIIKNSKSRIVSLIVSDVINDDLSTIASGLTYYDDTTFEDALKIIEKHGLSKEIPSSVLHFLKKRNSKFETLKKEEFPFARIDNFIISSNIKAVRHIGQFFSERYSKIYIQTNIGGDVNDTVEYIVKTMEMIMKRESPPFVFIMGGEVSVNIKGNGRGGRNQELAMLLVKKTEQMNIVCAAFATDGKDGNSEAAGAIIDRYTMNRAKKIGLNICSYIDNNDSYNFFNALGDCILTEDTRTNVADVLICIVLK